MDAILGDPETCAPATQPSGSPPAPSAAPADRPVDHADGTPKDGTATSGTAKVGPPVANGNRIGHGLRTSGDIQAHRLVLGSLPASMARVERQARQFRSALESAVVTCYGSISISQACFVNSAARWERHGLLALRWLRERHGEMDDATRLAYSRDVARASTERDKALAALKLDRDTAASLWDSLDRSRRTIAATPATRVIQDGGNASESILDDLTSNCPN